MLQEKIIKQVEVALDLHLRYPRRDMVVGGWVDLRPVGAVTLSVYFGVALSVLRSKE
jgi:hypothetical protein